MTASFNQPETASEISAGGLVLFPSLPDLVGYAGSFAASLNGRLLTGGGSQFPDKPLWLDGVKAYSDRIFALGARAGVWTELKARLPRKMAHFAFAASPEAIYLAGGMTADGLLKDVCVLRSEGDEVAVATLPDLPKALVYATAALANGRLYIAGGQHDAAAKEASAECWSLDLGSGHGAWRHEPDLPGTGTFVGAMASDGSTLYFIGGVGFDASGKGVQSKKIYQLVAGGTAWEELPDMPEPRVGPVTPCPILPGGRIFVMGGYASAFVGERRDHPGFSRQTFLYDIAAQTWSNGPVLPHEGPVDKDATSDAGPAPMVAAPGVVWRDHFVAVGGEVRASVRTPAVVAYPLNTL